ncbi:hypothetical protein BDR06DRAFT_438373 [Suillus hirtellus]|nr:hypothetical protein BDR06DRAFT_438373 [Suillus hirtellus]
MNSSYFRVIGYIVIPVPSLCTAQLLLRCDLMCSPCDMHRYITDCTSRFHIFFQPGLDLTVAFQLPINSWYTVSLSTDRIISLEWVFGVPVLQFQLASITNLVQVCPPGHSLPFLFLNKFALSLGDNSGSVASCLTLMRPSKWIGLHYSSVPLVIRIDPCLWTILQSASETDSCSVGSCLTLMSPSSCFGMHYSSIPPVIQIDPRV